VFHIHYSLRSLFPFTLLLALALLTPPTHAQKNPASTQVLLNAETFTLEGRPAFIMLPKESAYPATPKPWILYAPALPRYPDQHESWMHQQFLDAGVAIAGIDVGEAYGSPDSQPFLDALYHAMIKRGYANKPCLLGRSRGGLWVSSWALRHPDKVAGIAGIYPVFDLTTYPGLNRAAPAYGLSPEDLKASLKEHNPIEKIAVLAEARVPACFIHGNIDTVVPLKENSARFVEQYQAAGAANLVTLIIAQDQGHNFWPGFFHCKELIAFTIEKAIAAAREPLPLPAKP
jgi:dipeptidyl aminopeptidase/acylaminoacyl peptidase